jgi:VWFA-related protein
MKPSLYRAIFLFCFIVASVGVQSQETPPANHGALIQRTPEQLQAAQKKAQQLTFRVIVTDSSGNAVQGLRQNDFTIQDDGHAQPVTSFKAVHGGAQPPDRVILLLDTMNNTFDNVAFERKGITEYLRQNDGRLTHPTSLIIFSDYGVQVGKPSFDGNVLINDLKKAPTQIRENAGAEGADGIVRRFQASIRALTKLVTYEAAVPGHATIVWFGPGWPLLASAHISISTDADRRGYFSAIVDLTNRLREGDITLDNIAPSALIAGNERRQDYYKIYLNPVLSERQSDSGNLALPVIALHSGGQVLQQGKTLPQEIATCVSDADNYYLLTIAASSSAHPDTYHAIDVTLVSGNLTARTNAGYYSEP